MSTEQELKKDNPLHKEFQNLLDQDFKDRKVKEGEIIQATITEITPKFIVADAKLKMEAMIPIEEFKNGDELSKLKVGSKIEVFLDRIESGRGEIIVSREKAKRLGAWQKVVKAFDNQEEIVGEVKTRIKGGYIFYAFDGAFLVFYHQVNYQSPFGKVDHLLNIKMKVLPVRLDRARGNQFLVELF